MLIDVYAFVKTTIRSTLDIIVITAGLSLSLTYFITYAAVWVPTVRTIPNPHGWSLSIGHYIFDFVIIVNFIDSENVFQFGVERTIKRNITDLPMFALLGTRS